MAEEHKVDGITEEEKALLKKVVDHFTQEDLAVRESQIRQWRKLKLYWSGFSRVWYSETAHDWRVWDNVQLDEQVNDQAFYDKPVNVFRAYLESIIAALSITIPGIRCVPDDADNPLDVSTAKAGNKIAELISKHNNVAYLWLHALYVYCTEGLVACYSYPKEDESYGTYEEKEYKDETVQAYVCPFCNTQMADELFVQREQDEFMPEDEDVDLQDLIQNDGVILCPQCAAQIDPELQKTSLVVEKLVGVTKKPKSRQCMEVYGGLYVKVPNYAMKQEDIPYLQFAYETHYANVLELYPGLRGKIDNGTNSGAYAGTTEDYGRWGRLNPQYKGEFPLNNVTVRNTWFRPAAFNILTEDEAKLLKKRFPNGAKTVFINDCFAAAENECLDDCWTLTHNPLSDYLHHDPLGLLLVNIQDITNDLISLIVQTIEQGIPQTFVDPAVLDTDAYGQLEATPGGVYNTKPVGGSKNISDAFYQFKASALSDEVLPFSDRTQQLGQLVVGAQPSIFGGELGGSKTASEYSMSRAQALQRLQTPWKMFGIWWKEIFGKVIPSFIKEMSGDERLVEKDKQGNYINVFIRKAETIGKIGEIELEASEQLPTSWAQIKDTIMRLIEINNPEILQALTSPENLPLIAEAVGIPQFKMPGEESRNKQNEETQMLLQSQPIEVPVDPMMIQQAQMQGQIIPPVQQQPSVPIDVELDDHVIEAFVLRQFLIGEAGRLAKIQNPEGYMNALLHYKAHNEQVQLMQMQQAQAQAAEQSPEKKPKSAKPQEKNNAA